MVAKLAGACGDPAAEGEKDDGRTRPTGTAKDAGGEVAPRVGNCDVAGTSQLPVGGASACVDEPEIGNAVEPLDVKGGGGDADRGVPDQAIEIALSPLTPTTELLAGTLTLPLCAAALVSAFRGGPLPPVAPLTAPECRSIEGLKLRCLGL